MNKDEYLEDSAVAGFIGYLRALILAGDSSFIQNHTLCKSSERSLSCLKFIDAYQQYWFAGLALDQENHLNQQLTDNISGALLFFVGAPLPIALETIASRQIIDHETVNWLLWRQRERTLASDLMNGVFAVTAIDEEQIMESDDFCDGSNLRSDFSLSRIYSLSDNHGSTTYDSRVAAALGFFIIEYLKSSRFQALPDSLSFIMHKDHNPSKDNINFTVYGAEKNSGRLHGLSSLHLNWIIGKLTADTAVTKRFNVLSASGAAELIEAAFL
jgi:hypothetical protein